MTQSEALQIIYQEAVKKMKMKEGRASQYVGEVVAFHIGRLSFHQNLNAKSLEEALKEEAEFHLSSKSEDVA
ncbi:MAG: hypothetical protein ACLGHN_09220 [Bacteriovoracia bacterium]